MAPRRIAACYYLFCPHHLATCLSSYAAIRLHGYANTLEWEKPFISGIHRFLILIILVRILVAGIRLRGSIYTCLPSYTASGIGSYTPTYESCQRKGDTQKVPPSMRLEVRRLILIDRRDAHADPSHDGNRHGVTDSLVARPVGTFLSGLALPRSLSCLRGALRST